MGHQNASLAGRDRPKTIMNDSHLIAIDPTVLDRKGAGRVDAQDGHLIIFEPGAKIVADIAFVTVQGCAKAVDDIVEGDVMIAGDREHRKASRLQSIYIAGRRLELGDAGALGKVAADDHEVGPTFLNPRFRRGNDLWIVRAEVEIGQMCYAGHRFRERPKTHAVSARAQKPLSGFELL